MLPNRLRRLLLLSGLGPALGLAASATAPPSGRHALSFPRDHGSHPAQRTEWWYVTGHVSAGSASQPRDFGFQLTFFRARVDSTQRLNSRFAARQLLFAHAALTDVHGKRFSHAQRVARQGFDVARSSESDTAVRLFDWSLERRDGVYHARLPAGEFDLDLAFTPTGGPLLQGDRGLSRKGPQAEQSSFYYSLPQLAFEGRIDAGGQGFAVAGDGARAASAAFAPPRGAAWLDHEWSDGVLAPNAVGWDWIGMNLFDGSALMAFRIRDKDGRAIWDGGSFRHPKLNDGMAPYVFSRGETVFQALRGWKSPLTNATYPVEWLLRTPAEHYVVRALLDNQELDSRRSTGAVYWEGLCDLFDSQRVHVGRGYLEMTGYAHPLVL